MWRVLFKLRGPEAPVPLGQRQGDSRPQLTLT